MEIWLSTTILLTLIILTTPYKLQEDDVETVVTSKPINFGHPLKQYDQATQLSVQEPIHEIFKPSKELLLFSPRELETYQYTSEDSIKPSRSSDDVQSQLLPPSNIYKYLLKPTSYEFEYQNDKESEENDDISTVNVREELIYGRQKPPSESLASNYPTYNMYKAKSEKYRKEYEKEMSNKKRHPVKQSQEDTMDSIYEYIPFPSKVPELYASQMNDPENIFPEDFWQPQNSQKQKPHKSKHYNKRKHKYKHRHHKGLDFEHGSGNSKKRVPRHKYRDQYYSGNVCNRRH